MFKKLPILLLLVILISVLTEQWIPVPIKSLVYALSLTIKSILIFCLPILIFLLLYKTASQLAKGATKLIFLILLTVIASNCCSTFSSFFIGNLIHSLDISIQLPEVKKSLAPLWDFTIPSLLSNSAALLAGLVLGLVSNKIRHPAIGKLQTYTEKATSILLTIFMYMIPFFVCGFILKLAHDGILSSILQDYALIFLLVAVSQLLYVFLIFLITNKLSTKKAIDNIKNLFPAALTGFGTMSSAAAMPLTLLAAEKNAKNASVAKSCIPATVNIHLIGDCLAIPLFAFAVLKNFNLPEPSFLQYSVFAIYFIMAKFSVAAIPGGGIIVMLPILESQLGFSPEMLSLISALYILFDPVITAANILGNGAFSLVIDKAHPKLFRKNKLKLIN